MSYRTRIATLHNEAQSTAAIKAGEYLDKLGKTDLATMTHDEWNTFITTVCDGYCGSFATHNYYMLEEEIPF